ncbi:GTPase [Flavobacterium reichenbachii]|uniref:GTPase n=1 Tax=Flavobacterium reichenbachii TaxID=362418 RepID=UPI0006916111|nr:GTPase [Flavobacterium reichenbachii]OXB16269.1 hypothetical protein B0A68_08410 [Flavobacterium reichenbachii]
MNNKEFDFNEYQATFENSYNEKHGEFEDLIKQKLIISLIGSVNAGKSKTINALTGIDYTEVKARAGSTETVSIYPLNDQVFIADTPGLYDINEKVSNKASEFVEKDSDVILYFINAASGITAHEKKSFESLQKLGKPTIVVLNKIDALDKSDIVDVINQTKEELGIFPIPISSKTGEGIELLEQQIQDLLKFQGKDLLFVKVSKFKGNSVKKWINAATVSAAAIGALPIPGSDIVALTGLQVGLALKIAYIYGIKTTKQDVMKIVASTITGSIGRQISRWSITALKAAGWIPGAQLLEVAIVGIASIVAGSMTYAFGWACNAYYKSGMTIDLGVVGEIFEEKYKSHKEDKKVTAS